jgi:hypothetical protein
MQDRHFTNPVEEIAGTVESASAGGVTLKEYPGRLFKFSSVSTSTADMSARILGEQNNQVSPSCRTQNTSRARQTEAQFMNPRSSPGLLWLPDPVQGGKFDWCLRRCGHKTLHACQAEAQSMDPGFGPGLFQAL